MNYKRTFHKYGYETNEEIASLLNSYYDSPAPYPVEDIEDVIKWTEFVRALKERDFTPGDEFSLNGIRFEVKP